MEDEKLKAVLKSKGKDTCPNCGREIDRGDMAWNNGSTEYGTGYCVVECQCQQCDTELFEFHSWHPAIDDIDDLAYVIDLELNDI
jgi:hypothetical protein